MMSSTSAGITMASSAERKGKLEGQRAFTLLKPLCTQLLHVNSTSRESRALVLESLLAVIKDLPSEGLQRCMDYALFPLLLFLDEAVACRSSSRVQSSEKILLVGDKVAESVLLCVEAILQRCILEMPEQVTMLLQKLTAAAMLSASEASEEFRHGVVKCLQALLYNLRPCDSATCMCKSVSPSPFDSLRRNPVRFFSKRTREKVEEHIEIVNSCPMGYMQAESMSAAIGHLISLLLQIGEAEVVRGSVGSGKLRRDVLFTLRTLIWKVGTADGLAFFLPGVASGLTKVMFASRAKKAGNLHSFPSAPLNTSGAAGWPAAVEEAIRGITEILVVVLGDEKNAIALEVMHGATPVGTDNFEKSEDYSPSAALEALQSLSVQRRSGVKDKNLSVETAVTESSNKDRLEIISVQRKPKSTTISTDSTQTVSSSLVLRTERTKEWLDLTASRVGGLLAQTLPFLCAHPSPSVRLAVIEAAAILLVACGRTLGNCTILFLECLLALACDDWEYVASAAQSYLTLILGNQEMSRNVVQTSAEVGNKVHQQKKMQSALVSILSSILDQLPRVVFSSDISMSILHARRLAAAMYFLGPDGLSAHLLDTLVTKQKFVQTLTQCLSFNTNFIGSLGNIISRKPTVYGPIVSEIKSKVDAFVDTSSKPVETRIEAEELPTVPPWLSRGDGSRLYRVLAYVLRLAGLSAITDQSRGTSLVSLTELLLVNVRKAAVTISAHGQVATAEGRIATGQVQRLAATSVCVLNEIVYGASGAWNDKLFTEFSGNLVWKKLQNQPRDILRCQTTEEEQGDPSQGLCIEESEELHYWKSLRGRWQAANKDDVLKILRECAGDILHDYLSTEVWDQPTDLASASLTNTYASEDLLDVNMFQDAAMLQKVLMDGIGVLGIALGKAFEEGGFLGLVLFPLLEKLACSNYRIHHAASVSLNTICSYCQYLSVRDLVVANVDLVIDSICRQFRHLMMYPNAPNLLAAILRHTNAAADLLPLLEEPLRGVVLELDVLARRNHPHFTVPLLRALREITRASQVETGFILSKAKNAFEHCKALLGKRSDEEFQDIGGNTQSVKVLAVSDLEELMDQFIDRRRCRRAVAATAMSCLVTCGPLLASKDPRACHLALDTVEDGISTLSQAEEAGVHESKEKECIEQLCKAIGYVQAPEDLTSPMSDNEPKKLLPGMNKVWPHMVLCLRHAHTSVIVRALEVIASSTFECGGEFFSRRFQKDAVPVIIKLLHCETSTTLLQKRKPKIPGFLITRDIHTLDYNEEPPPSAVVLKVQEAVLKAITTIAARKKSAPALASSFSVVAASVVILACHVDALQEASTNAVLALAMIDPDLVWILVMDLVHGSAKQEVSQGMTPNGFPSFHEIFPVWQSPQDAFCMQALGSHGPGEQFRTLNKISAQNLLRILEISDVR